MTPRLLPWLALVALACGTPAAEPTPRTLQSEDGYLHLAADRWTLGTAAVEKTLALDGGRLVVRSFRHKLLNLDLLPAGEAVPDFATADPGVPGDGPWTVAGAAADKLAQGELHLALTLRRGPLTVTRHAVVYPGTGVVREWLALKNTGAAPLPVTDPRFFGVAARPGRALSALTFHWMTGAENVPGSWRLRTERLAAGRARTFDSYDPFPAPGGRGTGGDGVDARILLGERQVWPEKGAAFSKGPDDRREFDLALDVAAGDRLTFLVGPHGTIGYDTTEFDPTVTYAGGEGHTGSKEFGDRQGTAGWRYGYRDGTGFHELAWDAAARRWGPRPDNATHTPFVAAALAHPHDGREAARQWAAPRAGRVRVTGSVCNVGNLGLGIPGPHRMGSQSYAPWYALADDATGAGLVVGWDYMGRWSSSFTARDDGSARAALALAGYRGSLPPGGEVTLPAAFTCPFRGDLDAAGNALLDWQYRYLWDYTRPGWFPAITLLHCWSKGTGWGQPGTPWAGGNSDTRSQFLKVFRAADFIRSVGGDIYHRDWGWWDRAGDWNGPDFRATGAYLKKSGIPQIIYAFLYTVDPQSRVAREHPGRVLGGNTLDLSRPEVVAALSRQLDDFHARWGDFCWRNDSTPTAPRGSDDTPLLAQDQGLRRLIKGFLDRYPGSAFQAVNGGGNEAGYDYVRLAHLFQYSDGVIGAHRNYHASLLFPPDKLLDNGDEWNPDRFDKASWRGLLASGIMSTGDTWDPVRLAGLRELCDIYHYLAAEGVVGRWVRVYRPGVEGDDPTVYFQRLGRDRTKGIIIPKRPAAGRVVVRPRDLIPAETYLVTFHESPREERRSGEDLMKNGLTLPSVPAGELVYLNLPYHPGNRRDKTPPGPPAGLRVARGENMGQAGVEVSWSAATDDHWVSGYEVLRDGVLLDSVAKGTYFFDHSAGADPAAKYEVRAVDGAGNRSAAAAVTGPGARARVLDDRDPALRLAGDWQARDGQPPAHGGTLLSAAKAGAAVELAFEGRRVLVYAKLGDDCGRVRARLDGGPAETVETYAADDIWGYCVFRREVPAGRHVLRLEVTGEHEPRAKGTAFHLDGVRVEPE